MKHCKGFTLIEFIIVACIFGILATLAYEYWQPHKNYTKRCESGVVVIANSYGVTQLLGPNGMPIACGNGGAQ